MPTRGPAWLIFPSDEVPDRWRDRAVGVRMVPLLPGEAEDVLAGSPLAPRLTTEEERIVRLLAEGRTTGQIAKRLEMSVRSVERRLASLRDRFGIGSSTELGVWLRMGVGRDDE